MFFASWQAFFNMGGYGLYVWLSYAVSLVGILWLVVISVREKKMILQEVRREQQREKRLQSTREETL